MAIQGQILTEY